MPDVKTSHYHPHVRQKSPSTQTKHEQLSQFNFRFHWVLNISSSVKNKRKKVDLCESDIRSLTAPRMKAWPQPPQNWAWHWLQVKWRQPPLDKLKTNWQFGHSDGNNTMSVIYQQWWIGQNHLTLEELLKPVSQFWCFYGSVQLDDTMWWNQWNW